MPGRLWGATVARVGADNLGGPSVGSTQPVPATSWLSKFSAGPERGHEGAQHDAVHRIVRDNHDSLTGMSDGDLVNGDQGASAQGCDRLNTGRGVECSEALLHAGSSMSCPVSVVAINQPPVDDAADAARGGDGFSGLAGSPQRARDHDRERDTGEQSSEASGLKFSDVVEGDVDMAAELTRSVERRAAMTHEVEQRVAVHASP